MPQNRFHRRTFVRMATAAALATLPALGWAQAWPTKQPIRLVAVFPPGGSVDQVARILAPVLQAAAWARRVVVENRGGASGAIGTAAVARSGTRRLHLRGGVRHPRREPRAAAQPGLRHASATSPPCR